MSVQECEPNMIRTIRRIADTKVSFEHFDMFDTLFQAIEEERESFGNNG